MYKYIYWWTHCLYVQLHKQYSTILAYMYVQTQITQKIRAPQNTHLCALCGAAVAHWSTLQCNGRCAQELCKVIQFF